MADPNRFDISIADGHIVVTGADGKAVRAPVTDRTVAALQRATSEVVEFSGPQIDSMLLGGKANAPQMAYAAGDTFACSLCNRRFSKDMRGGTVESLSGRVDVCEGCYEAPTRSTTAIGSDYARGE